MKISAVLYAVVIIAFFMPFFMVSCEQTELLTINGVQLVMGGESKLQMDNIFAGMGSEPKSEQKPQKISPHPMAILAIAIAVIALFASLFLPRKLYFIPLLLSIGGILSLHLLKNGMPALLNKADSGMGSAFDLTKILNIKTLYGFWLADVAFLAAAVTSLFAGMVKKPMPILSTVMDGNEFSDPMAIGQEDYIAEPEYISSDSDEESEEPIETETKDDV
ncbi:MAG: hypothetical protein CVU50_03875 [Candidatus Cloacimonetes bacterium HGW-Cloacimonetes-3]|nr:MAG: hypothetical protein CVU50_03875 [Candidatus Cloacimonetes bacterium HGW-Cloacimonetes-3]